MLHCERCGRVHLFAGDELVAIRAEAAMAGAGAGGEGGDDLAVLRAAAQHQPMQAGQAAFRIDLPCQLLAALQQLGVLLQTVIDRPVFQYAPRLADALAVEHEAMAVPQMAHHVFAAELRRTARAAHAHLVLQLAAQLVDRRRLAGTLLQEVQPFDRAACRRRRHRRARAAWRRRRPGRWCATAPALNAGASCAAIPCRPAAV